jgi:hypothetical protein
MRNYCETIRQAWCGLRGGHRGSTLDLGGDEIAIRCHCGWRSPGVRLAPGTRLSIVNVRPVRRRALASETIYPPPVVRVDPFGINRES